MTDEVSASFARSAGAMPRQRPGLTLAALLCSFLASPATGFEVIGVGFPKTGLASLEKALESLNYKVYRLGHGHRPGDKKHGHHNAMGHGHGHQMNAHVEDLKKWLAAIDSQTHEPLDKLADELVHRGYQAILDVPLDLTDIATRLIARFPDAKVILTEHPDSEMWFKHYRVHMQDLRVQTSHWAAQGAGPVVQAQKRIDEAVMKERGLPLVPAEEDEERFIAAYEKHNTEIKAKVDAQRLLEFAPEQGWSPLCQFLGQQVPDVPYPHLNSAMQDQAHLAWQNQYNMHFWGFVIVILGAFLASVGHWAWTNYRSKAKISEEKANV